MVDFHSGEFENFTGNGVFQFTGDLRNQDSVQKDHADFHGDGVFAKGILLQAERGTVFIAARSISDLVKSLESDFPGLKIDKASLRSRRSSTWLEVLMEFQPTDGMPLPQMLDAFQKKTLAELEAAFGINSISEVKIRIGRVRPVRGTAIQ